MRLRNESDQAFSSIEVQVKRRADLVPNLVEAVKGYAKNEQGVFEAVSKARAATLQAAGPVELAAADVMMQGAVNGLFGIAVGAFLAWRTGEAKDFYLPGILITLAQSALLVISVGVRKPIIGYVWGVLANKGRHDWFDNKELFRTFQWLTLVWAGSLFVRAGVQGWLYLQDQATAIGVVRILISWPIYAATFAFTVWAVRRVTRRQHAELERLSPESAPHPG